MFILTAPCEPLALLKSIAHGSLEEGIMNIEGKTSWWRTVFGMEFVIVCGCKFM